MKTKNHQRNQKILLKRIHKIQVQKSFGILKTLEQLFTLNYLIKTKFKYRNRLCLDF